MEIRMPQLKLMKEQPKRKMTRALEKTRKVGRLIAKLPTHFPRRKKVITPQNRLRICFVCGKGADRSAKCRFNFFKKARNAKFFEDKGNLGYVHTKLLEGLKEAVKNSDVVVLMFKMNPKEFDLKARTKEEGKGKKRPALEGELFLAREIKERKRQFVFLNPEDSPWIDPNHEGWEQTIAKILKELERRYVFRG